MNCIYCHQVLEPHMETRVYEVVKGYLLMNIYRDCIYCHTETRANMNNYTLINLVCDTCHTIYNNPSVIKYQMMKWNVNNIDYWIHLDLLDETYRVWANTKLIYSGNQLEWFFPNVIPPIIQRLSGLTTFL